MKRLVICLCLVLGIGSPAYSISDKQYGVPSTRLKHLSKKELECLVNNAYHEAYGEGSIGMLLVTQVVFNRVKKSSKSACQVIYANNQFSWTDKKHKKISKQTFKELEYLVLSLYYNSNKVPSKFRNAMYFHNTSVKPTWSRKFVKLGNHRNHVFYMEA